MKCNPKSWEVKWKIEGANDEDVKNTKQRFDTLKMRIASLFERGA
jgi:hypothetical protein